MNKVSEISYYGNGFTLLPWADAIREKGFAKIPDNWLAVFPVIIAHANKKREAFPSYERISILAGVSKSTVSEAIDSLVSSGWIAKYSRNTASKLSQNVYKLTYGTSFGSRHWIALHHDIIKSGVWGLMLPSQRKVYLLFRAFAWSGGWGFGVDGLSYEDDAYYRERYPEFTNLQDHSNFLPLRLYDVNKFIPLSGLSPRTYQTAYDWLVENELIIFGDEEFQEGFTMPFKPNRCCNAIIQKLSEIKVEATKRQVSSATKRSLTCSKKRLAKKLSSGQSTSKLTSQNS